MACVQKETPAVSATMRVSGNFTRSSSPALKSPTNNNGKYSSKRGTPRGSSPSGKEAPEAVNGIP